MNSIPTPAPAKPKTSEELIVDHIAKTAVGARLSDIVRFVATASQQTLAHFEAEMRLERQGQPMHQIDYDPCGAS